MKNAWAGRTEGAEILVFVFNDIEFPFQPSLRLVISRNEYVDRNNINPIVQLRIISNIYKRIRRRKALGTRLGIIGFAS